MSALPPVGHSLAAPLRPNKGVNVLASEYDFNQFTVRHFAHALLIAAQSMRAWLLLHSRPPSMLAIHHGAASIIPTVDRNTPLKLIVPSYESTAS